MAFNFKFAGEEMTSIYICAQLPLPWFAEDIISPQGLSAMTSGILTRRGTFNMFIFHADIGRPGRWLPSDPSS